MIVTDASAVVDLLLRRPQAVAGFTEALASDADQAFYAPEMVEPETLNALRGMARGRRISEDRATQAVRDLSTLRLVRLGHEPLRPRVWALRHELSAYDASYLALAESLREAVLVTADRGLATRARRSLGPAAVRLVA